LIETALLTAPPRGGEAIFGRPLLERLLATCKRVGIKRFFIQAPPNERDRAVRSLGRFAGMPEVQIVESFDQVLNSPDPLDPAAPCLALNGNLVVSPWYLSQVVSEGERQPDRVLTLLSSDSERAGSVATGPLGEFIRGGLTPAGVYRAALGLPFALNGRPEDREEAERQLARSLKEETVDKDAFLARHLDRNLSWRISLRLARIPAVTANRVTVANTAVGLACGWMFASPSYWVRLASSLLFLVSITVDGVDGELARLTMTESNFGRLLDTITDNIVHIAIFAGIFVGCYRASGSVAYLYLFAVLMFGFSLCAVATYRAFSVHGADVEKWISMVDRVSGRDFAYLLVLLAAVNRLNYFAWSVAFGTYVFAFGLMWLTQRQWGRVGTGARC
jgi:phosphatidylglycerophosphate synthase